MTDLAISHVGFQYLFLGLHITFHGPGGMLICPPPPPNKGSYST